MIGMTTEQRHLTQSGVGLYFVNELTHFLYVCQSVEAHELSLLRVSFVPILCQMCLFICMFVSRVSTMFCKKE